MAKQAIDYIRQPDAIDNQSLEHLINVVEKYPYYHAARILMLRAMYQAHDSRFDKQLKLAAVYLPSRMTLFKMFEGKNAIPESPAKRHSHAQGNGDESRQTATLIDDFLNTMPKDNPQPRVVDATQDYMAYLMQQEQTETPYNVNINDNDNNDNDNTINGELSVTDELVTRFLNESQGHFELHDDPETPLATPEQALEENISPSGILTEAMAHIYIKQGKYDRAIEILRRISLNNPKKNRYFADQIRFLEKLVINQKASGNS